LTLYGINSIASMVKLKVIKWHFFILETKELGYTHHFSSNDQGKNIIICI